MFLALFYLSFLVLFSNAFPAMLLLNLNTSLSLFLQMPQFLLGIPFLILPFSFQPSIPHTIFFSFNLK